MTALTKINFKPDEGDILIINYLCNSDEIKRLFDWINDKYPHIEVPPAVVFCGVVGEVKAIGIKEFLEQVNEKTKEMAETNTNTSSV